MISDSLEAGVLAGNSDGALEAVATPLGMLPSAAGVSLLLAVGVPLALTSVFWLAEPDANREGLPLYSCQLLHNSRSEKEKIIQRMVRRMSIAPVSQI